MRIIFSILITTIFFGCKLDSGSGKELIEVGDLSLDSTEYDELEVSDEYLDVAKEHIGAIVKKDGKYEILSSDLVEGTFGEDYKNLDIILELYPETFKYSSKLTGDAASETKDSIVSLKFKSSLFEYRKIDDKSTLIQARITDELFLLQNGVRPGLDREETLSKFGLKEQIKQDSIAIVSEKSKNKILLIFNGDTLKRIELHPESK